MFQGRVTAALALAALAVAGLATARIPAVVHAQANAGRITLAEFKKLHDAGRLVVIDTRDAQSYRLGHIPGALLVPQGAVPARLAELKAAGKPVVAYCA